ncbi:MAG TPA: hypothetical protein VHT28_02070, partial [Silvibacterium sp.]|nr:hypothetical protein [Silvibacterium sp.]
LRILKNEIRKKKPVSVALVGDVPGNIAEIVERGVQPEILEGRGAGMEILEARGARRLGSGLDREEMAVTWSVAREPLRWLPVVDRLAAAVLDPGSTTTAGRRRWLETAPRYLGRPLAGQRYLRMSAAEGEAFISAVRREVEQGEIPVAVAVSCGGDERVIAP